MVHFTGRLNISKNTESQENCVLQSGKIASDIWWEIATVGGKRSMSGHILCMSNIKLAHKSKL